VLEGLKIDTRNNRLTTTDNAGKLVGMVNDSLEHLATNVLKVNINTVGTEFTKGFLGISGLIIEGTVETNFLEVCDFLIGTS
jgi:hypothetical protein